MKATEFWRYLVFPKCYKKGNAQQRYLDFLTSEIIVLAGKGGASASAVFSIFAATNEIRQALETEGEKK